MKFYKHLIFCIFFVLPVISFSQGIVADSTHGFSNLISAVYKSRSNQDMETYKKLIHSYYENKPMQLSHDDSVAIAWGFSISPFSKVIIYDTVTVGTYKYCKVEYTLNCTIRLAENQLDLLPHYNALFGASTKRSQDGYFDKSTSTYKYYPRKWALMVLREGETAWRMLEYNPKEVESWFSIEPREVFYAIERINGECHPVKYTQQQLGKLVYQSMVDGQLTSLYCRAGIHRKELVWASAKEGKQMTENNLYKNLIYKKGTVDEDSKELYKYFPWKDTRFSQVFSFVEKVKDMSFSAILVEFVQDGKYKYFEVESVLTPDGWRIMDDINLYSFTDENEAFIKKRKG